MEKKKIKEMYATYREKLIPIMYKLLGEYYYSKSNIDKLFGLELSGFSWQIPLGRIGVTKKQQFLDAFDKLIEMFGSKEQTMVLLLNSNLTVLEQVELDEALTFFIRYNKKELDAEGHMNVSDDSQAYLDLVNRSYNAIMELAGNDGEFTSKVDLFVKELEELRQKTPQTHEA